MKKIVFGITSLTLGGAERVLVDMVNALKNQYDITLFVLYAGGEFEKSVDDSIPIIHVCERSYQELTKWEKFKMSWKCLMGRKKIYRQYLQGKYDQVISFLEGPVMRIFATPDSKTEKIAWLHNDMARVYGEGWKSKIKLKIDQKMYQNFQKIAFVSKDNQESFAKLYPEIWGDPHIEKVVLYNYIEAKSILEKAEKKVVPPIKDSCFQIVTVTRLVEQKAIDRLIRVHARLIRNGFYHKIYVIGDGPEKENLYDLIQGLSVSDTFTLMGKKTNPYPYMKQADLFALCSAYEGYGMVLEEAKILNKPILITDTAAREAVKDYPNVTIVPNTEEAIYQTLHHILQVPDELEKKKVEYHYNNQERIQAIMTFLDEKNAKRKEELI